MHLVNIIFRYLLKNPEFKFAFSRVYTRYSVIDSCVLASLEFKINDWSCQNHKSWLLCGGKRGKRYKMSFRESDVKHCVTFLFFLFSILIWTLSLNRPGSKRTSTLRSWNNAKQFHCPKWHILRTNKKHEALNIHSNTIEKKNPWIKPPTFNPAFHSLLNLQKVAARQQHQ